jgi:PEP-CTERM motif
MKYIQWKRWGIGLGAAFALTSASQAIPLPANTPRYIAVVSIEEACSGGNSALLLVCGSSTNGAIDLSLSGSSGRQITAGVQSSPDGFALSLASVPGASFRGTALGQTAILSVVQFDDFIVTGPTPTVDITVTGRVVGTTENLAGPSSGNWVFRVGQFNASHNPDLSAYGDWVLPSPVSGFQTLFVAPETPMNPQPNWTGSQTMQVTTGQSFAMGLHFAVQLLSLRAQFSEVSWSFDVPDGYQLASANGLSVNIPAVPEPATWALMLAGMGVVGAWARRRR